MPSTVLGPRHDVDPHEHTFMPEGRLEERPPWIFGQQHLCPFKCSIHIRIGLDHDAVWVLSAGQLTDCMANGKSRLHPIIDHSFLTAMHFKPQALGTLLKGCDLRLGKIVTSRSWS